ncbi:hypothetical protein BGY98DRAFT_305179 [Russula aff. rugulosa BPL654]|nr:hypothetical protein BGY98DRAFT_305179 [Russula aff. rugulosa BPL654]
MVFRTCMALSAYIYREASSRAGAGDHHVSETTQEGVLEALESLGKYEWLVILKIRIFSYIRTRIVSSKY